MINLVNTVKAKHFQINFLGACHLFYLINGKLFDGLFGKFSLVVSCNNTPKPPPFKYTAIKLFILQVYLMLYTTISKSQKQ